VASHNPRLVTGLAAGVRPIKCRIEGSVVYEEGPMTMLKEFRCEICGTVTGTPVHWFVIQCGNSEAHRP
jgi:hypothetical protein